MSESIPCRKPVKVSVITPRKPIKSNAKIVFKDTKVFDSELSQTEFGPESLLMEQDPASSDWIIVYFMTPEDRGPVELRMHKSSGEVHIPPNMERPIGRITGSWIDLVEDLSHLNS